MKTLAIIQARMGSTRLPGKILKEVNGKTLLEYQIERIQRSEMIDDIVIATTKKEAEEPIIRLCKKLGISYYQGSEDDVLKRYYEVAIENKADTIVRLTSDCPLIDPNIMDDVIQHYIQNRNSIDYCSNTIERTFPRGLDVEVFSFKALEYAFENAVLSSDREHVTSFIYTNPNLFKVAGITNDIDLSQYRWTVDTIEDFELIANILDSLYPLKNDFLLKDVIKLLNENMHWNNINVNIEQKKL